MTSSAQGALTRAARIPAAMLACVLGCALGSAALAPLLDAPPTEGPLPPDALDRAAVGRPPGEALLLGRAMPLDRVTASDWELVPGIGPSGARALAEARPRTLDALYAVRGIGPARRAVLSGLVRRGR